MSVGGDGANRTFGYFFITHRPRYRVYVRRNTAALLSMCVLQVMTNCGVSVSGHACSRFVRYRLVVWVVTWLCVHQRFIGSDAIPCGLRQTLYVRSRILKSERLYEQKVRVIFGRGLDWVGCCPGGFIFLESRYEFLSYDGKYEKLN